MAISKKCLSCDHYRESCTGHEKPCDKWAPISFGESKDTSPEPKPSVSEPDGESLIQKFNRIGAKRQAQALEAIRKLRHLTSNYHKRTGITAYTYEWTEEMALELVRPIEEALEALKGDLLGCSSPREHGLIEEK